MTEATSAPRRSRKALAARIAGIVGAVLCAVLILGVWLGRGAIGGGVDNIGTRVSGGFDRALAATAVVSSRLDDATTSIDGIGTDATELAATSSPSADRLAGLEGRLARLGDSYRDLRTRYADVRENVVSAISRLQGLSRFVPGVSVPEGAVDALTAFDTKLQAIDDAFTSVAGAIKEGQPRAAVAGAIATQVDRAKGVVTQATAAVGALTTRLEGAKADAAATIDSIQRITVIGTLGISLVLVWVLLLNVALYALGRAWQREADAAVGSAPKSGGTAA